jgi:Subtilase family
VGGTISRSKAENVLVSSTGPNSTVGGLVGANGGTISNSSSTSPVTAGADSFIGGLAGANFGSITNSKVDPVITGNGPNDVLGGIAGLNIGQLSGNTANVTLVSNGAGNQVGGVAGVNGTYNFSGANPFTPGATTQTGDIGNSTATGSGFSGPIGSTVPPSAPAFPNWVPNCSATLCDGINNGILQTAGGPPLPPLPNPNDNGNTNGNYGSQQTASFTVPPIPNNNTSLNLNAPNFNQQSGGGLGGNSANGGTNGGGSNNGATGSLGSGTHGGNGAPPGTRLIDMPVIPLPPESGMPPPGETFFVSNEVSLHVGNGMSQQQIEQIAQQFGLTIVATNPVGMLGRTIYTLQISDGRTVQEVITAFQGANLPVWVGYVPKYGFAQEPAGRSADIDPVGDPAQYVIDKFHLNEIHRLARGDNVTIAVIDSEIDVRHPDLAGVVTDRYDAGCGATMPDAHGTGMTGAIASRRNLLGVAPKVKVIAICAFGGEATAESTSLKIIRGLDYAVSQGAKIINMSFAGPRDPALSQALQIARERGVLLVAAAGNAGPKSPPLYPGADPNVMAVTATDDHDRLFNRANQGKYISVAAPGVDILVPAPGGGVALTTGTSVATAHVTGVAALLIAQKSTRTPEELRAILVTTAKDLGPKGFDTQFGAGLVDPLRALQFGSAKSAAIRLPTLGR